MEAAVLCVPFFFFNEPATPEIYPLPLHAPLPISRHRRRRKNSREKAELDPASEPIDRRQSHNNCSRRPWVCDTAAGRRANARSLPEQRPPPRQIGRAHV